MEEYEFNINHFDVERIKNFEKSVTIRTENFETINYACQEAHVYSRMTAIIGDAGYGKTKALIDYADTNSNVYLITLKSHMTPKIFYEELLTEIGFKNKHSSKNIHHIIDSIAYFLNSSRDKNLLIFDESGKFTPRELLYIHDLRDSTLKNTGYIMAGPPYFEKEVLKNVKNELQGIPEFYRRINNWIELGLPSYNEKLALCRHYGIKDNRLTETLCKSPEFKTLSALYDAICNFGILVLREINKK